MHDRIFMSMLEYEYSQPSRKQGENNSILKSTFDQLYKEDALKRKRPAFKIHYFN